MSVPFLVSNDTLSKLSRKNSLYPLIVSILMKEKQDKSDLVNLEILLRSLFTIYKNYNFTACIGGFLPNYIVDRIVEIYKKTEIDIPLINSIIAIHNSLGVYYKEILELSLFDNMEVLFPEKKELNRIIFEQFPYKDSMNIKEYINILKVNKDFKIEIYDFKQRKYIIGTLEEILDREEIKTKIVHWDNMSVYFD